MYVICFISIFIMNQSSKFQFGFIALDYHFYAITIIITITTKHLSLPEWSIGLLALPLLFLTVLSRATVIVKLKVLDTAEAQDRFLLPPRKVCGTILELLCVSFFFLQIIQSDFFLARLDTSHSQMLGKFEYTLPAKF